MITADIAEAAAVYVAALADDPTQLTILASGLA
jgi:hypothetical protein